MDGKGVGRDMSKTQKAMNHSAAQTRPPFMRRNWDIIVVLMMVFVYLNIGQLQHVIGGVVCGKSPILVDRGSNIAGGSYARYYIQDDGEHHYNVNNMTMYYCTPDKADANYIEPGFSGYSNYYDLDLICPEKKARIAAHKTLHQKGTDMPEYYYEKVDDNVAGDVTYFCTEQQAINNGFGKVKIPNLRR